MLQIPVSIYTASMVDVICVVCTPAGTMQGTGRFHQCVAAEATTQLSVTKCDNMQGVDTVQMLNGVHRLSRTAQLHCILGGTASRIRTLGAPWPSPSSLSLGLHAAGFLGGRKKIKKRGVKTKT